MSLFYYFKFWPSSKQDYMKKNWVLCHVLGNFQMFVLNALCSKAKGLRIFLRPGIRHDFLEIHLLSDIGHHSCMFPIGNFQMGFDPIVFWQQKFYSLFAHLTSYCKNWCNSSLVILIGEGGLCSHQFIHSMSKCLFFSFIILNSYKNLKLACKRVTNVYQFFGF